MRARKEESEKERKRERKKARKRARQYQKARASVDLAVCRWRAVRA